MKDLKKHILVILCALQVQYSLALNLQKDWLIDGSSYQAKVTTTDKELCLVTGYSHVHSYYLLMSQRLHLTI